MKTCLVVDDSSVVRKIARRILEELDFQIVEAEDGEKALEVCKSALADLERFRAVLGLGDFEFQAFQDPACDLAHNAGIIDHQARLHFGSPASMFLGLTQPFALRF